MNTQQILIYKGTGTNACGLRALTLHLRGLPVKFADQAALQGDWESRTQLLVFPGGRDIPYHEALKGPINARIRRYVEQGGNYLGLCAGGYYGSRTVEFEKDTPLEVTGSRELSFFPGTASGPAYGSGRFRYNSEDDAKIAPLVLHSGAPSAAYYNGGCTFLKAESHPNIHVLARYQEIEHQPPAVIECCIGQGIAILSGVHPEYSVPCAISETQRKQLFVSIMQRLGVRVPL